MDLNKFPKTKGERKSFLFDDIFFSYQTINCGDDLIVHPADKTKLTKCPKEYTPTYFVYDIQTKGRFLKKTFVVIEKI